MNKEWMTQRVVDCPLRYGYLIEHARTGIIVSNLAGFVDENDDFIYYAHHSPTRSLLGKDTDNGLFQCPTLELAKFFAEAHYEHFLAAENLPQQRGERQP